jgi:DNA-binding transcriptional LysR family regulator
MDRNALFFSGNNLEFLPRMAMFAAVVQAGGFGRAADKLGVSKSRLSKHIAALEDELGVRLMSRTTRSLRPTEAGELFLEHCTEVLRVAAEARGILSAIQEQAVGRLRISIPVSLGRVALRAPLLEYARRFPRVRVDVDVSDQKIDLYRSGVDLAIRVGPAHDPELVVKRLADSRQLVVGSPAYLKERGVPASPDELTSHECLLYEYQSLPEQWVFQCDGKRIDVQVSGRLRCNSGDMLADAAVAGLGLAWLPDFVAREHLQAGRLVAVLDSQCRETSQINIVLPARHHVPVKVRELMRMVEEHVAHLNAVH